MPTQHDPDAQIPATQRRRASAGKHAQCTRAAPRRVLRCSRALSHPRTVHITECGCYLVSLHTSHALYAFRRWGWVISIVHYDVAVFDTAPLKVFKAEL